jgi:hypothetical protein
MDEIKWFMIAVAVIFGVGGIALAVDEYGKHQCAQSYVTSTRSASEIALICGITR